HRHRRAPAKMRLGQHVGDLIEGAADEVHELELRHGTQPGERRAKAGVDDGHLGDGRIDHALRAEAVDESVGDLEGTAVDADVFANAEHRGIPLHLLPDPLANRFQISDRCHESPLPSMLSAKLTKLRSTGEKQKKGPACRWPLNLNLSLRLPGGARL